jgi:hypothetical protein
MEWLPIESAPKKGRFLVCGGRLVSDLGSDTEADPTAIRLIDRYGDDFSVADGCYYSVEIENPTHWQPLPTPPTA